MIALDPPTKLLETMVFIDAQNVYRTAREAFGWESESSRRGNFRALALGDLLTSAPDRELVSVCVYTGVPNQLEDNQGYRASRKRFDTWTYEGRGKVSVFERNLHYAPGQLPREKGVDVLLAIHVVRLAFSKSFDLAIVVSADNDLVPALELVADLRGSDAVESVSLHPEPGCQAGPPLGVAVTPKRKQIRRRMITKADYERIEDTRSYNPANPGFSTPSATTPTGGSLPGQSGRQLPHHTRHQDT